MKEKTSMFPVFRTHGEARCYGCGGSLFDHKRSGWDRGRGEFQANCARCKFMTFYELANPRDERR